MPVPDYPLRLIAFYLPQFHPIPENDAWWGQGFTEWRNVTKGLAAFPGHYQPHVPGELGYYDLREPQVRQAQADLARQYGVHGFCYYHYWFHGKQLLDRPFREVLASGQPDFPFCLCWANESWSRTWDDLGHELLIKQTYSDKDDLEHIRWLINAFRDKRYIRVAGKPIFLVYRAKRLANPQKTAALWREEAYRAGIGEIFLGRVESFPDEHTDPRSFGFDAAVELQPDWANLPIRRKVLRRLSLETGVGYHDIYDYAAFAQRMLSKPRPQYPRYPCITPSWDNIARHKNSATILRDSTPDRYEQWLRSIIQNSCSRLQDENLIFVNAWNEWGEGNHLEPCQKWGRGYLEATQRALQSATDGMNRPCAS